MGDSCCDEHLGIGEVKALLEEELAVPVYSVAIGKSEDADVYHGFIGNLNDQVDGVCETLTRGPSPFRGGFNMVGFSQGGLFVRALVERCPGLKVRNLLTLGAPHSGVMDVPNCINPSHGERERTLCKLIETLLDKGAYAPFIRDHVVQAQYFKDVRDPGYLAHNPFLPDINQEHVEKNPSYKERLLGVERLVLYRFTRDSVVVPRDSAWFSYFDDTVGQLVPLAQQPLWTEDWLGLKQLSEAGKLEFKEIEGEHMQFSLDWFRENIVEPYLR